MADLGSILGSAGIGGAIGKAIVSLELDTKKYQAELKGAQASTVASTNGMSSSFANFKGIASTAFAAVGVAAVAGLAFSVKAAIEANEAHLKLANTFANNANLADSSIAAFEAQAESIRALTGVDDEAIISGQALAGTMGLTGAQVQELTPLVVDLASKYDIDLQAAFKAVGRAAQGSSGALSRYIGTIEAGKDPTETYTNLVDKLGQVQGFAAERADAEPWRVIGSTFEEIAESIGQELLPTLQDLADTINDNIGVVQKAADGFGVLLDIFKNIEQISFAPWTIFGDAVKTSGDEVADLTLKIPGLKDELEALNPTVEKTGDKAEEAGKKVHRFGDMSKKAFSEFKDSVVESVQVTAGEFEKLNDAFSTTPRELQKQMALAVQIARREHRALREIFSDKSLTDGQKEALASLPADQRDAWARAGEAGKRQILHDAMELKRLNAQNFREITNAAKGPAKEGGTGIGHALGDGVAEGIRARREPINSAMREIIRGAINAGKEEAGAESPSKVMRELGLDMMEGLYQGITKGAQKAIDASRKSIEKIVDKISSELDKVKSKASDFAGTISGAIGGFGNIGAAFTGQPPIWEGGLGLSAVIAQQVAGAQELADVLEALKRQGAGKALLAQVAEAGAGFGQTLLQGGPAQIEAANQALQDIANLARQTGKGLSEEFFGKSIDRLERRLEHQNDLLHELVEIERLGHDHAIILDGVKVSEAVRSQLIKTGQRNPGAGIP